MSFRPIQLILVTMVVGILLLYFNRLRTGLLDRVVILLFAAAGIIMVVMPELTMRVAALVGVGRGADLFTYLALLGLGFFGLVVYSKLRDLETTIAKLARAVAVANPSTPDDAATRTSDNT